MIIIRIIADLHGKYEEFRKIAKDRKVIQLGDFGYRYDQILAEFDPKDLRIIFGNHSHHIERLKYPHFINTYGNFEFHGLKFFALPGAFSIDKELREKYERIGKWPKTWWEEEELTYKQLQEAIDLYEKTKPDIILSHDCPRQISKLVGNDNILKDFGFNPDKFTTRTSEALQRMWEAYQPKLHVFGHYHRSWKQTIGNTKFICLKELEYLDITQNGELV